MDGVGYFVRSDGSVTAVSAAYKRVYFANRFGRLPALDSRTGAEIWRTSVLDDPGDKAQSYPPRVLLVRDAFVATAGDTAFSRSPAGPPDRPRQRASIPRSAVSNRNLERQVVRTVPGCAATG
ncbi:hypothetical protein [Streptomyces sp. GbtcB6]|uniref:hypothetical protein n=1 Tax=Streptomyces sp. GbtcB6 TaxID=2824751 RepID=UPI001C301B23|nr:hypothetical protein [Streptomyces sp. GbtcB6]